MGMRGFRDLRGDGHCLGKLSCIKDGFSSGTRLLCQIGYFGNSIKKIFGGAIPLKPVPHMHMYKWETYHWRLVAYRWGCTWKAVWEKNINVGFFFAFSFWTLFDLWAVRTYQCFSYDHHFIFFCKRRGHPAPSQITAWKGFAPDLSEGTQPPTGGEPVRGCFAKKIFHAHSCVRKTTKTKQQTTICGLLGSVPSIPRCAYNWNRSIYAKRSNFFWGTIRIPITME